MMAPWDEPAAEEKALMKPLSRLMENPQELVIFGGEEGLAPLRLSHLAPGEKLPFHIFTSLDGVPGEFVLTWRRGQFLPKGALDMVWGYFAVAEAGKVLSYLVSRVEVAEVSERTPQNLHLLTDTLLVWTQHFFSHEEARTPKALAEAHQLMAALGEGLKAAGNVRETAAALRRHDSGLVGHCLNVCLLTLSFAPILAWKEEEVENLALAALL
ncbi:MAG: hypothetical protein WAU47_15780, partial [Desulfobaccales bacterium]